MHPKLLLINHSFSDVDKINTILRSEYPEINIYAPENSNKILNHLENISPDMILFDMDYPEGQKDNNLKLLSELLKIRQIPTIVLSSDTDYKRFYEAGTTNFIHKPYSDLTLISNFKTTVNYIGILESIRKKEVEIYEKNQKIQFQIENELKQREIIIQKNKEIMADIRYASKIQHAVLPSIEFINENIFEYFILHQPKSHVSGDFYWMSRKNDLKIIAVGDCTGHGLSGALMHMLGAVYLNEIVSSGNFDSAKDILDRLRYSIMKSLNQNGTMGETQDGLDIALCIIDYNKKTLQFAGANNPLYIVRDKELTEIKGDRMPVGIHINFDKPYTNHNVELKSNDQIYLFSDGYADQFGGPKNKKFRYKQFQELLVDISCEPMNIQKEILNNVHDTWRGSTDQIDDILVFGLKIK